MEWIVIAALAIFLVGICVVVRDLATHVGQENKSK